MTGKGQVSVIHKGKKCEVEWELDFASLSEKNGEWYWSPDFNFEGDSWFMYIYPVGRTSGSLGFIDLGLQRGSYTDHPMNVQLSFSFKTLNGRKEFKRQATNDFKFYTNFVSSHFLSRSDFEWRRSEFLSPSGMLTVVCTLKRLDSAGSMSNIATEDCSYCKKAFDAREISSHERKCRVKCPVCSDVILLQNWDGHECQRSRSEGNIATADCSYCEKSFDVREISSHERKCRVKCPHCSDVILLQNWDEHECQRSGSEESTDVYDIVKNINCFLKERKGVDVTFKLETSDGGREVSAHKLVLAMRSSFFGDEFYSGQRNEEHATIPLKGVDPDSFERMIRYCYDCEPALKTTEEACALIQVALQFGVTNLVDECGAFLKQIDIEPGNVFTVLQVSERMGDSSLTDKCLKMLEEETKNILASFELRDVTSSMVQSVLKLTKLSLHSEYELILWILDWAQLKSEDEDSNCKSAREYLGNLLGEINFLSLTTEQFAKFCKDHSDFFTEKEMASFSLNIAIPGTRELPEWYNKDLKPRVYTGSKKWWIVNSRF